MNFIFILMCIVYGLCAIYFATKNDYTSINSFMNKSATKNPNQYFAYMIFLFLCSALSLSKAIFVFMAITFVVIAYYKKLFPPKVIKYGSIVSGMLILLYIIQGIQNAAAATAIVVCTNILNEKWTGNISALSLNFKKASAFTYYYHPILISVFSKFVNNSYILFAIVSFVMFAINCIFQKSGSKFYKTITK